MRVITIGDIHGSTLWKDVKVDEYDKVIFMGDYTDHWTYTDQHILKNLSEIIVLKEINPDKVVLLLGNHDLQYMFGGRLHSCSGFRPQMQPTLYELFTEKKDLFQAAYYYKAEKGTEWLWTHAGVSAPWYATRFMHVIEKMGIENENLGDQLNLAFESYMKELFDVGYERYGNHPNGGPFWADRSETQHDPLPNINQIIGHTKLKAIQCFGVPMNSATVTYVDVLEGDNPDFLTLDL